MRIFETTLFCLLILFSAISNVRAADDLVLTGERKAILLRFSPAPENENPQPLFTLTKKDAEEIAMTGLETLAIEAAKTGLKAHPVAMGVYWFVFSENVMSDSLDLQADEAKHRLFLIGEKAYRLEELRQQGVNFKKNDEVRQIMEELYAESKNSESSLSFAGKALVHAPYVTVEKLGVRWISRYLGKWVSGKLNLGEKVNFVWKGTWQGGTRTEWRLLTRQGKFAQKWTDIIIAQLVKVALKKIARENVQTVLDDRYRKIMESNPSTVHMIPPQHLRVRTLIAVEPVIALPLLPPPVPIAPVDAVPGEIRVYKYPVVNAPAVENQIIDTETRAGNIKSIDRQEYRDPPPSRIPSSIRGPRGSWDGRLGQGLY